MSLTSKGVIAAFVGFAFAAVSNACASDDHGNGAGYTGGEVSMLSCADASSECAVKPSYAKDVAPILGAHCVGCHGPGGENADMLLDTYDDIVKNSAFHTTVPSLVFGCIMPPAPLPALAPGDKQTLYCWFSSCYSFDRKSCKSPCVLQDASCLPPP